MPPPGCDGKMTQAGKKKKRAVNRSIMLAKKIIIKDGGTVRPGARGGPGDGWRRRGARALWLCGGRPRTGRVRSGGGRWLPGPRAAAPVSIAVSSRPSQPPWPRSAAQAGTPVSEPGCFAPPVNAVCSSRGPGLGARERVRPQALGLGHRGSLWPPEVSGACPSPPSPSAAPVNGGCGAAGGGRDRCPRRARGQTERARRRQTPDPEQFRKGRLKEGFCWFSSCFASL